MKMVMWKRRMEIGWLNRCVEVGVCMCWESTRIESAKECLKEINVNLVAARKMVHDRNEW